LFQNSSKVELIADKQFPIEGNLVFIENGSPDQQILFQGQFSYIKQLIFENIQKI